LQHDSHVPPSIVIADMMDANKHLFTTSHINGMKSIKCFGWNAFEGVPMCVLELQQDNGDDSSGDNDNDSSCDTTEANASFVPSSAHVLDVATITLNGICSAAETATVILSIKQVIVDSR